MRLGIGSYTYPWAIGVPGHPPARPMNAVQLLERAGELGVCVVQIADNLPLHRLSPSDLDAVETRALELGIRIEVGTRGIAQAHVHTYLRLAERFRSPILRVVVDTGHHRPMEDELVGTIAALVPSFERKGIVLAIENHDRTSASVLARTLERIDSAYVGICLDTVNSFGALEGPDAVIDALGPWVVNLHVKDLAIYRPSYGMGFTIEGRPAGQGRLDIPRLLERMGALNRDLSAILELWTPPETSLAETVAKEGAWAKASVAYLRQLIPA